MENPSVTGNKFETSLKTYTGYTDQNIKRKMSDTISDSLRTRKQSKKSKPDKENVKNSITTNPTEDTDFDMNNYTLEPLSNDQLNKVMTYLQDNGFEDIMKTINTQATPPAPPKSCASNTHDAVS